MGSLGVKQNVGQNIKHYRLLREMKGDTLAKKLGITKGALSQMESGLVDIKISTLFEIADFLDVDICSLVASHTIHSVQEFKSISHRGKTVLIETVVVDRLFNKIETLNETIKKFNERES